MRKRHIPFLLVGSLMLMGFDLDVAGWFGGLPKEKFIAKVEAGPFKPGTQALGVEKDINNRQAVGNGLIPNIPLNDYLNGILAKLLDATGVKGYPGKVYIRAAMQQWGADTSADGNIYVNAGTLRNLDTEDQVAALLAHELSHALLRHHDSDMFVNAQKRVQTFGEWVVIAKTLVGGLESGAQVQLSSGDEKRLRNSYYLVMLSSIVISPAWNRGQESDADRLGVDILAKAGYDIYAMTDLLEKEQSWQKSFTQESDPKAINESLALASNSQEKTVGTVDLLAIFGKAMNVLVDKLSQKHPDPAERLKAFKQYAQKFYRGMDFPEQNAQRLVDAKSNAITAQVIGNYEWAYRAEKLLGNPNASMAEIKQIELYAKLGLTGRTANHAYPLLVASQVLEAMGDKKSALSLLEKAADSPEAIGLVYMQLAQFHKRNNDHGKALQAALKGYNRLNESPALKAQIIHFYKDAGDTTGATALTEQCALQNPEYKDSCRAANADKKV